MMTAIIPCRRLCQRVCYGPFRLIRRCAHSLRSCLGGCFSSLLRDDCRAFVRGYGKDCPPARRGSCVARTLFPESDLFHAWQYFALVHSVRSGPRVFLFLCDTHASVYGASPEFHTFGRLFSR